MSGGQKKLTQNETANIGVTPSNGGTTPRYNLMQVNRQIQLLADGETNVPSNTILHHRLLDNIYGSRIGSSGCGLKSSLHEIERVTCQFASNINDMAEKITTHQQEQLRYLQPHQK